MYFSLEGPSAIFAAKVLSIDSRNRLPGCKQHTQPSSISSSCLEGPRAYALDAILGCMCSCLSSRTSAAPTSLLFTLLISLAARPWGCALEPQEAVHSEAAGPELDSQPRCLIFGVSLEKAAAASAAAAKTPPRQRPSRPSLKVSSNNPLSQTLPPGTITPRVGCVITPETPLWPQITGLFSPRESFCVS